MNQLAGAVEAAAAWEVAVAVEGNGAECHLEVEAAGAVWGSEDMFFSCAWSLPFGVKLPPKSLATWLPEVSSLCGDRPPLRPRLRQSLRPDELSDELE